MSKTTEEVKQADMPAWQRIGDLAEAIRKQYEIANGSEWLCKSWAQEIVMQCDIISQAKKRTTKRSK